MPLYDIRCSHCDGIFEKLLPMQALENPVACPYCAAETAATPLFTGGHVKLRVAERWQPRNGAEQLAGRGATGPGTQARAGRSSVLHNCKGHSCSICDT